jgi:hypothetical protein
MNSTLVLYGGQTNGVAALGDVWALDPIAGSWTQGPEPFAPARQLYALASDGSGAFVFGGGALDGGYLDDMWKIEPVTLELVPVDLGANPPARSGAALIVDSLGRRLLLFGGKDGDGFLGDMWEVAAGP